MNINTHINLARTTRIHSYLQALGLMVNDAFTFLFWLYDRSFLYARLGNKIVCLDLLKSVNNLLKLNIIF